jgi:hypothetical protein
VQSVCSLPSLFFNQKLQRWKIQEGLHCCRRCGPHTACQTQARNLLDFTKVFFLQWSDVLFSAKLMRHMSTSVVLPKCIPKTPPSVSDLMFSYCPAALPVCCTDSSVSKSFGAKKPSEFLLFVKSTINVFFALTFSPISPH